MGLWEIRILTAYEVDIYDLVTFVLLRILASPCN